MTIASPETAERLIERQALSRPRSPRRSDCVRLQDIIILRHKLAEGLSQGETSEALRSMQDELQRLQVQVIWKRRGVKSTSEVLRRPVDTESENHGCPASPNQRYLFCWMEWAGFVLPCVARVERGRYLIGTGVARRRRPSS